MVSSSGYDILPNRTRTSIGDFEVMCIEFATRFRIPIIIIIIIIISFMQGIYIYIPETNHVPREYSVSAIVSLLFMVSISLVTALALLYFYVSTFLSMCAVPNLAVFCSSFTSWLSGMLLMNFLNDFYCGVLLGPVFPL